MTWKQQDVARAFGPTLPLRLVAMWHSPAPPWPRPCHRSVRWPYIASQMSISCRFKRWMRFVHRGFMGPSSFTWRPSTDFGIAIWTKSSYVLAREPTMGANQDPTMHRRASRRPHHAAQCPRKLHHLSTAYKYPLSSLVL